MSRNQAAAAAPSEPSIEESTRKILSLARKSKAVRAELVRILEESQKDPCVLSEVFFGRNLALTDAQKTAFEAENGYGIDNIPSRTNACDFDDDSFDRLYNCVSATPNVSQLLTADHIGTLCCIMTDRDWVQSAINSMVAANTVLNVMKNYTIECFANRYAYSDAAEIQVSIPDKLTEYLLSLASAEYNHSLACAQVTLFSLFQKTYHSSSPDGDEAVAVLSKTLPLLKEAQFLDVGHGKEEAAAGVKSAC